MDASLDVKLNNIVIIIALATATEDTSLLQDHMLDEFSFTEVVDTMFYSSVCMFEHGATHDEVLAYWQSKLVTVEEA